MVNHHLLSMLLDARIGGKGKHFGYGRGIQVQGQGQGLNQEEDGDYLQRVICMIV